MEAISRSRKLKHQQWIKMATFLAVLLAGLICLVVIQNLLLSFVIAVMISYLVSPLISYLEGAGISRIVAIIAVYCFFTILAGLIIWALSPLVMTQLSTLKERLPEYVDGTVKIFDHIAQILNASSGGILQVDLSDHLHDLLTSQSSLVVEGLPRVLSSSASVLFLSPLLGFFILKDGHVFSRELLKLVPNNIFELVLSLQYQIGEQIAHYIRARIIESLIVGLVSLIGFVGIGFPFAFLLAVFAAVANLIPYVGPLFGAAPGIIIALINHSSPVTMALVLLVYVIGQVIDNFFIVPFVVARIVNLHPITVVLAVLLGAQAMGILGMLISIPVASAAKVTFQSIYTHLTDHGT
jgi:putative permease